MLTAHVTDVHAAANGILFCAAYHRSAYGGKVCYKLDRLVAYRLVWQVAVGLPNPYANPHITGLAEFALLGSEKWARYRANFLMSSATRRR